MKRTTVDTINIEDLQENVYCALCELEPEMIVRTFCGFFGSGRLLTRDFADYLITEGLCTPGDIGVDDEDYL